MTPSRSSVVRIAALASLTSLFASAPTPALASPDSGAPLLAGSFHDGDRIVAFERLAEPATTSATGGPLTPVRLRFPGRAREARAFVDRTAIVQLEPGAEEQLVALGARVVRPLMPSIGLFLVEDTTGGDGIDVARRLQPESPRAHGIRRASPNLYLQRRARGVYTPNDPRFPGQWYFENLHMTEAWGITLGDASTTVVVVDTGCDLGHVDLVDKMDPGRDVVDGDDDPSPDLADDGSSHGTACAGLIAATTDNNEGIAGACPECRLRCVRLLADKPVPTSADVDAFQFAFDTDAAVVSNSWGFVEAIPVPSMLEAAINNVFDNGRGGRGALVLFAMGNDDREVGDDEMEAVRGVLAIGAINNLDDKTSFTNFGNCSDLVAPTGTLTTDITGANGNDPGDYTTLFGGTSSACPVAAGVAALLVSAAPDRTSAELYEVLIQTARPAPYAVPDASGHDPVFGYGIIDPVKALELALGVGGTGGSGGSGGSTDTGGTGGSGGSVTTQPGGCSCSMEGEGAPLGGALYYVASLSFALIRARRRRR